MDPTTLCKALDRILGASIPAPEGETGEVELSLGVGAARTLIFVCSHMEAERAGKLAQNQAGGVAGIAQMKATDLAPGVKTIAEGVRVCWSSSSSWCKSLASKGLMQAVRKPTDHRYHCQVPTNNGWDVYFFIIDKPRPEWTRQLL